MICSTLLCFLSFCIVVLRTITDFHMPTLTSNYILFFPNILYLHNANTFTFLDFRFYLIKNFPYQVLLKFLFIPSTTIFVLFFPSYFYFTMNTVIFSPSFFLATLLHNVHTSLTTILCTFFFTLWHFDCLSLCPFRLLFLLWRSLSFQEMVKNFNS